MTNASTILLIDGDPAVRSALKFSLELDGFAVDAHADAEALAAREQLPAEGCLVLDQHLPGMTGLDLLALLRARQVDLPAILITTHPSAAVRKRAAEGGVEIIEKPLLGDGLAQAVQAALERRAARTLAGASS